MRIFRCVSLLAVAFVVCFALNGATDVRAYERPGYTKDEAGGNSRLLIWREADFGTFIYLKVYIDGISATILGQGAGYEAVIRPGEHLLTISTTPSPYGQARHTDRRVMMRPGETYAFTALWRYADRPILETSTEAQLSHQAFPPYRR